MLFLTDLNIAANHFDAEKSAGYSQDPRCNRTRCNQTRLLYVISPLTTELELAEMSSTDSEEDEETENEDESSRGINTHP